MCLHQFYPFVSMYPSTVSPLLRPCSSSLPLSEPQLSTHLGFVQSPSNPYQFGTSLGLCVQYPTTSTSALQLFVCHLFICVYQQLSRNLLCAHSRHMTHPSQPPLSHHCFCCLHVSCSSNLCVSLLSSC